MLVNGLEAWIETPTGRYRHFVQRYAPDVVHPDGVGAADRVRERPVAALDLPARRRHRRRPRARRPHGAPITALAWRLPELAPPCPVVCAPARLRTGLPLDPSRERRVPVCAAMDGASASPGNRTTEFRLIAPSRAASIGPTRVVPQLSVREDDGPGARLRRGPGVSRACSNST